MITFFLLAFVVALIKLIAFGDVEVFPAMLNSTFDMAKTGIELSLKRMQDMGYTQ